MEKHSIEIWDQLVHSTLHPTSLLEASPEQVNAYLATSIELKESLRRQFLRDTLYNKTEKETELLVERHQIIVTTLLNMLFDYQQHDSITSNQKQIYHQVAGYLEDIIAFMKNSFARYFNIDLYLPIPIKLREDHEVKRQLKIITKSLPDSEINDPLINILEQAIKVLLPINEESAVTYRQMSYFKNLLKEISCYLSTPTASSMYASLTDLLICWNFNELTFMREVCNNINNEVKNKETDESRLQYLRSFMKQVSQLTEKSSVALNMAQPTAKQMILDWLSLEISYRELKADFPESKNMQEDVKINTSLSVPVLALLTRLLKDAGIFTNTNQTEILKFVSSHFTTQKKLEVSYNHLQSKYYKIDEDAKKKLFDHLMKMAQRCKKL
jgi:hypothetical protein